MESIPASLVMGGISKAYLEKTLEGLGALKGSPCYVKSFEYDSNYNTIITLAWIGTDGTEETSEVTIKRGLRGLKGDTGDDGVSVTGINKISETTSSKTYRISLSDSTYFDFTVNDGTTTDLSNYYTKEQVESLVSAISALNLEVVTELPTEDIDTLTIYLVPKENSDVDNDVFDEYLYIDGAWEHIGSTSVNLANYYTKSEMDALLDDKVDSDDLYEVVNDVQINLATAVAHSDNRHSYTFENGVYSLIVNANDASVWNAEFSLLMVDPKTMKGKDIYMLISEPLYSMRLFIGLGVLTGEKYELTSKSLEATTEDGKLYKINFDTVWAGLKTKDSSLGDVDDYTGSLYFQGWYLSTAYTTSFVNRYHIFMYGTTVENRFTTPAKVDTLIKNSDPLSGKVWEVCGDSFSSGYFPGYVDKNGVTNEQSPEIYDSTLGLYKTFAYNIAKRYNMRLIMSSMPNTIMALAKTSVSGSTNTDCLHPFANTRYRNVSPDANYVTIAFGINDCAHCNLGEITDVNTNETFYGAWHVVLRWLIQNRPNAKIGIILYPYKSSNSNYNYKDYYDAVKEVAAKFGIPVLDLWGKDAPLTIFGRYDGNLDATIEAARHTQYVQNAHPNIACYEAWTNYVEAWLKTL